MTSHHPSAPSPFLRLLPRRRALPKPPPPPYDETPPVGKRRRKSTTAALRPQHRQSTHRYHTFPTPPPKTPSEQAHQNPDAWFSRPAEHPFSSSMNTTA
ncbi:hypothetical protein MFIFM68171_04865 [Madurella fahalii]|uniref:Uncharacterized protein n=1 Tax=Madurella fahalii TaxID=1157608 RepID=A0ABQ0GAP5_9PEZI